jgi:hypothetical protein
MKGAGAEHREAALPDAVRTESLDVDAIRRDTERQESAHAAEGGAGCRRLRSADQKATSAPAFMSPVVHAAMEPQMEAAVDTSDRGFDAASSVTSSIEPGALSGTHPGDESRLNGRGEVSSVGDDLRLWQDSVANHRLSEMPPSGSLNRGP